MKYKLAIEIESKKELSQNIMDYIVEDVQDAAQEIIYDFTDGCEIVKCEIEEER